MPEPVRRTPPLLWVVGALALVGCESVGRYLSESPEDRLVEESVAQWAERGRPFLDGVSGNDTVASVTPTGTRGWEVAVGPPGGGLPTVWTLEIPRAEVYPLFAGAVFADWLDQQARMLGVPEGLPAYVTSGIRDGEIRAVGDLEVRYGPANGAARTTVERVAYLVPRRFSDATEWHVQPASGPPDVLVDALERVVDHLAQTDPRMRDCLGVVPLQAARSERIRCYAEVLARRFGEG